MSAELDNARAFDAALQKLRADVRPDLVPFLTLPRPERPRVTRARLAQFIQDRVAANGNVTREELEAGGFTDAEIRDHFHKARRIARVEQLGA